MSRPHAAAVSAATTSVSAAATAAAVLVLSLIGGCAHKAPPAVGVPPLDISGSPAFGTFVKGNEAVLKPVHPVNALYSVGDAIYVYTADNTVYTLSGGLDIRYVVNVTDPNEKVRPPVVVNNEVIFPTTTGLEVFSTTGATVRSIRLKDPLTSNVRVDGRGHLVAGTAAPTGGMVSIINPTKIVRPVSTQVMVGNILSAPVTVQGTVFAANERGTVFAIDPQDAPARAVWGLKGMGFKTDGQITADLIADEFGVYVASTDTKLYVLDRTNGRIKWRYSAQAPLRDSPLVTKDAVYQIVPANGLVALSKTDVSQNHDPIWTAADITKVLSTDDKYVYAIQNRDRLVALGLTDGKVKFSVAGKFDYFVAGPEGKIVAATNSGAIVTFQRGTFTGDNVAAVR